MPTSHHENLIKIAFVQNIRGRPLEGGARREF